MPERIGNLTKPLLCGLVLAAVMAGCGSARPKPTDAGRTLFGENCAVCHSLSSRDDPSLQGGSLLPYHLSREALLEFERVMPVRPHLSEQQLGEIADFVHATEQAG